jgi:hypothetical protein
VRRQTSGLDWHPIIHWRKSEVLEFLQRRGLELHELGIMSTVLLRALEDLLRTPVVEGRSYGRS